MNELLQVVLTNLTDVGLGVLLFIMAYVSNMALSLYYNVKIILDAILFLLYEV